MTTRSTHRTSRTTKNNKTTNNEVQVNIETVLHEVKAEYEKVEQLTREALTPAINLGEKLIVLKTAVKKTERKSWMDWCSANLPMSHRTATGYMKLARGKRAGLLEGVTSLTKANEALAKGKPGKKTAASKPGFESITQLAAMDWLSKHTEEGFPALQVTARTMTEANSSIRGALAAHKQEFRDFQCAVLFVTLRNTDRAEPTPVVVEQRVEPMPVAVAESVQPMPAGLAERMACSIQEPALQEASV